jgi:hypothetical protein
VDDYWALSIRVELLTHRRLMLHGSLFDYNSVVLHSSKILLRSRFLAQLPLSTLGSHCDQLLAKASTATVGYHYQQSPECDLQHC